MLGTRCAAAAAAALSIALLVACTSAPLPEAPARPVPAAFRQSPAADDVLAPEPADGWWRVFNDSGLDRWVHQARRDNPGLEQAAARLARAAAALGVESARSRPQLEAGAGASRLVGPLVNATGGRGTLFDAHALLNWDADVLQRLSRQRQSAVHDLQAQQALQRQAGLVLEAEVAQTYLAWRALTREQQALEAVLESDRALATVAERRVRAGLAPAHVKSAVLADLWADEAEGHALARRRALMENALIALAGGVEAATLPASAAISGGVDDLAVAGDNAATPVIPTGLPSRMLQRRGDVAAAEQVVQAARLRLGLARDAWFPSLTLTVNAGLASSELGQWLRTAARSAGFGLLASLPLLDGGRLDAERAAAEATLREATAAHRERVLQALREVEDQLVTLHTLGREAELRRAAVDEAAREAERVHRSWRNGLVGEAEPVLAVRARHRQRRLWLQAQAARQQATVALIRALGGGWSDGTAAADAPGARPAVALTESAHRDAAR